MRRCARQPAYENRLHKARTGFYSYVEKQNEPANIAANGVSYPGLLRDRPQEHRYSDCKDPDCRGCMFIIEPLKLKNMMKSREDNLNAVYNYILKERKRFWEKNKSGIQYFNDLKTALKKRVAAA